jgi:hypothetical protein
MTNPKQFTGAQREARSLINLSGDNSPDQLAFALSDALSPVVESDPPETAFRVSVMKIEIIVDPFESPARGDPSYTWDFCPSGVAARLKTGVTIWATVAHITLQWTPEETGRDIYSVGFKPVTFHQSKEDAEVIAPLIERLAGL